MEGCRADGMALRSFVVQGFRASGVRPPTKIQAVRCCEVQALEGSSFPELQSCSSVGCGRRVFVPFVLRLEGL